MGVFGNADIIAVNQDKAGHQVVAAFDSDDLQIFVKTLASGENALAVFNRTQAIDVDLAVQLMRFRDDRLVTLMDLRTKQPTRFTRETKLHVEPRQTLIFRTRGTRLCPTGSFCQSSPAT